MLALEENNTQSFLATAEDGGVWCTLAARANIIVFSKLRHFYRLLTFSGCRMP